MTLAIGTPSYGGKKKNNSRLVDGDNVYRILPPLGELAAEGIWAVYECLHWGFKGTKGMRPFRCIQKKDFKTKMIKVQCPECNRIAEKLATLEDHKKRLEAEGKSKADVEEQLKPLSDWLFSHNLDKKWYVNALTMDGKITRLALPHRMYVQLQEKISEVIKDGVDPIAVDGGVWFNLKRSGTGNQTTHSVSVVQETVMAEINGVKKPVPVNKAAPLTADVIQRLTAEAHDLKNSFRTLGFEDINRLVTSGGSPEVVDAVFSAGEFDRSPVTPDADEPEPGAVAKAPEAPKPLLPPETLKKVATADDDVRAKLEAQMKAMQEQYAALAKPPETPPPAANAPAAKLTDEDFIKQFGFSK